MDQESYLHLGLMAEGYKRILTASAIKDPQMKVELSLD